MVDEVTAVSGKIGIFESQNVGRGIQLRVYGVWRFSGVILLLLLLLVVYVALVVAHQASSTTPGAQGGAFILCAVFGGLGLFGIYKFIEGRIHHRWYARGVPRDVLGKYSITPSGLCVETEHGRVVIYWPSFNEVALYDEYWLLISAGIAYPVPRRFFAGATEERAFMSNLIGHLEPAARARSTECEKFLAAL